MLMLDVGSPSKLQGGEWYEWQIDKIGHFGYEVGGGGGGGRQQGHWGSWTKMYFYTLSKLTITIHLLVYFSSQVIKMRTPQVLLWKLNDWLARSIRRYKTFVLPTSYKRRQWWWWCHPPTPKNWVTWQIFPGDSRIKTNTIPIKYYG